MTQYSSGYALVGYTTASGNKDLYLVITDLWGDEVESWTYDFAGGDDEILSISPSKDGEFVIAGYVTDSIGYRQAIILKITSSGDTSWRYTDPENLHHEIATDVIDTGDGFVFVGSTTRVDNTKNGGYPLPGDSTDFFVKKIKPEEGNENVQWEYIGGYPGKDEGVSLAYLDQENTLVVAGNRNTEDHSEVVLMKLTETGIVTYVRIWEDPSNAKTVVDLDTSANEIAIVGNQFDNSIFYSRLDFSLNSPFCTTCEYPNAEASSITFSPNQKLIITGTKETSANQKDILVLQSQNGMIAPQQLFGDRGDDFGAKSLQLHDSSLVIAGTVDFGLAPSSNFALIKIGGDEN